MKVTKYKIFMESSQLSHFNHTHIKIIKDYNLMGLNLERL